MTATNHVLTGSVLAFATVGQWPVWAILPVAFLLHFVLDALPHFGQPDNPLVALARLKWLLPLDAAIAASVLLIIAVVRPEHWLLVMTAGIVCSSPDLWSARRFFRFLSTGDPRRGSDWFSQFHFKIQWGERLWGIWVELAWALGFGFLLISYLS
jgi:hypothetical protein